MAMEKDKRIRLLKIWEILRQETDENNPMGTETLRNKIAEYGIHCDRRTIYDDIRVLNDFGYEIIKKRSTSNEYYVMDRTFDIPEVQILMDAVQAASFVTTKKTEKLIDKIAQLAGSQRAEVLKKNTVEFHTPKSNNEDIYYIVNEISEAITTGKQVEFYYFDYDINHRRVYRKNKKRYIVNPLSTVFCLDNYYLMCYDDKHGTIAHYRVDRMDSVNVSQQSITETEKSKQFDLSRHKRQLFGMFSGEGEQVTIVANKSLVDHIFDKFGDDTKMIESEDGNVTFSAEVQVSPAFLGWCCSFGSLLKVTAPQAVADRVQAYATEVISQYK